MSIVMRRLLAPLIAAVLIAGCGGSSHLTGNAALRASLQSCPQAAAGHGSMGACAPKSKLGLTAPRSIGGPLFPDRSNNDPCYCGQAIRAQGQVGLVVKANQGTGFVDSTAVGMVQSARGAGLAVGMYDFDQDYTVAEAQVFVSRLHAAGIWPWSTNTFPAYLDVEFGSFSYSGLRAQVSYLRSQGYRVGIYTGDWYWGPHAGCQWPAGVSAWLSGYPNAPVPCGEGSRDPATGYNVHQFTSTPIDLNVYLGSRAQFQTFVHASVPPKPKPKPHPKPKPRPKRGPNYNESFQGCFQRGFIVAYDRRRGSPLPPVSFRASDPAGCHDGFQAGFRDGWK
jgi:hypothetical protein